SVRRKHAGARLDRPLCRTPHQLFSSLTRTPPYANHWNGWSVTKAGAAQHSRQYKNLSQADQLAFRTAWFLTLFFLARVLLNSKSALLPNVLARQSSSLQTVLT